MKTCVAMASASTPTEALSVCVTQAMSPELTESARVSLDLYCSDVRFGCKVSQVDPKWDKSGLFQIRFQYICLIPLKNLCCKKLAKIIIAKK